MFDDIKIKNKLKYSKYFIYEINKWIKNQRARTLRNGVQVFRYLATGYIIIKVTFGTGKGWGKGANVGEV